LKEPQWPGEPLLSIEGLDALARILGAISAAEKAGGEDFATA
jgi:hypothetical protein